MVTMSRLCFHRQGLKHIGKDQEERKKRAWRQLYTHLRRVSSEGNGNRLRTIKEVQTTYGYV